MFEALVGLAIIVALASLYAMRDLLSYVASTLLKMWRRPPRFIGDQFVMPDDIIIKKITSDDWATHSITADKLSPMSISAGHLEPAPDWSTVDYLYFPD